LRESNGRVGKNTGIKRIILAGGYSLLGFKAAFCYEAAFRQELLLVVILITLSFWLDVDSTNPYGSWCYSADDCRTAQLGAGNSH